MKRLLVFMPVYNAGSYLAGALQSVLTQEGVDFDLLVLDDGSTDGSANVLAEVAQQDPRVILLKGQKSGPAAAMNRALAYGVSSGYEYLARTDADDINLPGRLRLQLALLEQQPNLAAVSGNAFYISEDGRVGASTVPTDSAMIHSEILSGHRGLIQGCCVFRISALQSVGGYREFFSHSEDADVFMRLAEKFELGNVGQYIYEIRLHRHSHSVHGVRRNTQLARYALVCSRRRRAGKAEPQLSAFLERPPLRDALWQWRELAFLELWRRSLLSKHVVHKNMLKGLAALIDPVRVRRRIQRSLAAAKKRATVQSSRQEGSK